ncbi:cytochrome c oxidase assembly protein [Methylobacillus flagellatus]|uniref:cytochrome c oxidase assembly protein n=1 Tax=Methylobacillus flagellatus TaxID=405 RepID=UPI0010F86308|nr:cytochrome c oxidase assembly protein [Methylobacillus flagellatus]
MAAVNQTWADKRRQENRQLGLRLLWIVAASILFVFSLVPLYDLLCKVTGLNGKTDGVASLENARVDMSRMVNVEFTSSVMPGLGWNFYPKQPSIQVRPGQIETVLFVAKNITNQVVAGQAVPSVSPGKASSYFKKIECFCFERQELQPGETREMPLRFYVSPDMPDDVRVVTLSYAFYSAIEPAK